MPHYFDSPETGSSVATEKFPTSVQHSSGDPTRDGYAAIYQFGEKRVQGVTWHCWAIKGLSVG